jgi:hypothetical protein
LKICDGISRTGIFIIIALIKTRTNREGRNGIQIMYTSLI